MQTTNCDYEGIRVLKAKVISLPYIFQVLYVLCFTRPRYQLSVYRTIGPLVTIYGRGDHLGHVTNMPRTNFRSPYPSRLHIKFGFDWPSGFGTEDL